MKRDHNLATIVVESDHELVGVDGVDTIYSNPYDDDINTFGNHVRVENIKGVDTSGSDRPHIDFVQVMSDEADVNSQFFGGIANDINLIDNSMSANSKRQGLVCFDGLLKNVAVSGNKVRTNSDHHIHLSGVLNGFVENNNSKVVLTSARFGGGHDRSFHVESFLDVEYAEVSAKGNVSFKDLRGKGDGVHGFNLGLFRKISLATPYLSFNQHFEDCLDEYERLLIEDVEGLTEVNVTLPSLADVISSHEGTYTSYNRGRAGDAGNAKVPLLTIGEYIKRGALPYGDPSRIWAVGRYQFVPSNLKDALNNGVAKHTDLLTPERQESIFVEWIMVRKRKSVYRYITTGSNLTRAMIDLSKEWASLADPRTGKSYYDKRNNSDKAHTGANQIAEAMQRARALYLDLRGRGLSEKQAFVSSIYNKR